ncbi:hypothetical protein CIHG_04439 [Coccidioides immitis H538.4]|uniref:Uncharacterized protein n=1 Tax=Coccidioides immitis H538.4 TaxID=396776 RepID=A0A0J8RNI5_COCIT|nr:hypothetical protein CIHG_04439 [Coccidioides immitis H538.4]
MAGESTTSFAFILHFLYFEHKSLSFHGSIRKKDTAVVPQHEGAKELDSKVPVTKKGLQFWAIICSLCVTSLLGALEITEIATSFPTIVRALDIGDGYVWVTNALFSDNVRTDCD